MMSNGSQEVERVRQARCIVERMRGRLLRPTFQALDSSAADLSQAVECLRQLDVSSKSPIWHGIARRKLEAEVVALRHAIRSVEELLKNAGKFYAGLARLMAPDQAPPNYTAGGTSGPAAQASAGSVVVHG
jgi:hypothetical protein